VTFSGFSAKREKVRINGKNKELKIKVSRKEIN
jgi:hypothetical protein